MVDGDRCEEGTKGSGVMHGMPPIHAHNICRTLVLYHVISSSRIVHSSYGMIADMWDMNLWQELTIAT